MSPCGWHSPTTPYLCRHLISEVSPHLPVWPSLGLDCTWRTNQDVMQSCLGLKGHFGWIFKDKILTSATEAKKIHERMTRREREAVKKLTVPVLKTLGQGFTYIDTWIKIGENKKWKRVLNGGRKGNAWQQPHYTIPIHPWQQEPGTGKVGSGLTNSFLPSGVWHFRQLAILGQFA